MGLGSNLENPLAQVRTAIIELADIENTRLIKSSALYLSKPMGPQNQPDYVNAVVKLQTGLQAEQVLQAVQLIEAAHDRRRDGTRWGPRTLDIDVLLYGDLKINTPNLKIPHPGIPEREFVLYPLFEIAPDLYIPGVGPLKAMLKDCQTYALERINSE